MKMGSK